MANSKNHTRIKLNRLKFQYDWNSPAHLSASRGWDRGSYFRADRLSACTFQKAAAAARPSGSSASDGSDATRSAAGPPYAVYSVTVPSSATIPITVKRRVGLLGRSMNGVAPRQASSPSRTSTSPCTGSSPLAGPYKLFCRSRCPSGSTSVTMKNPVGVGVIALTAHSWVSALTPWSAW